MARDKLIAVGAAHLDVTLYPDPRLLAVVRHLDGNANRDTGKDGIGLDGEAGYRGIVQRAGAHIDKLEIKTIDQVLALDLLEENLERVREASILRQPVPAAIVTDQHHRADDRSGGALGLINQLSQDPGEIQRQVARCNLPQGVQQVATGQ